MKLSEIEPLLRSGAEAVADRGLTYAQARVAFALTLAAVYLERAQGSQTKAAELLDVSQGHLSSILSGARLSTEKKQRTGKHRNWAAEHGNRPAAEVLGGMEL